jgi:hypothetical protein
MTQARIFHTATLLRDGRVLIAGGNFDSSTELYDPATGTFTPTGSMTINQEHVATLLSDGRVLVAGDVAELYDPATGKFTPTGSMLGSCNCMGSIGSSSTAPLLSDGRVLVPDTNLDASSNQVVGSAELYDPASGTFSQTDPMSRYRLGFTDTLLADGRVLFAGDQGPLCAMACPSMSPDDDADRASAELYVP